MVLCSNPNHSVSIQDFELVKPISKGAYGRVFLARKKNTGDLYAIKVMNKQELFRKNQSQHIQAERRIMAHADNPFVVKMFYAFQSKNHLYIVMEFVNGGDLYSMIKNVGNLNEDATRVYAAELVLALTYLHDELHVIHRDLKPDNILIDSKGFIKLIDFGLSQIGVAERTASKRENMPIVSVDRPEKSDSSLQQESLIHSSNSSSLVTESFSTHDNSSFVSESVSSSITGSFTSSAVSLSSLTMSSIQDSSQISSFTSSNFGSQNSDRRSNRPPKSQLKTQNLLQGESDEEPATQTGSPEGEVRAMTRDQMNIRQENRKLHKRKDQLSRVGTPDYMAPELLLGTYSGPANDWWSVGTIVYELLVGFPPFNDTTPELIFNHIINKEMEWPIVGV